MPSFRFSCTACGACCNTPPTMSWSDAIALSDAFIGIVEIRTMAVPEAGNDESLRNWSHGGERMGLARKRKAADAMRKQLAASWNRSDAEEKHGFDVFYTAMVSHYTLNRADRCPALKDGLCSVYDRRPSICRLVPFDALLPLKDQGEMIENVGMAIDFGGWDCDTGPSAPVAYDSRKGIIDPDALKTWEAMNRRDDFANMVAKLHVRAVLEDLGQGMDLFHLAGLTQADPDNRFINTDMLPVLAAMRDAGSGLGDEAAIAFFGNQIRLLEAELAGRRAGFSEREAARRERLFEDALDIYRRCLDHHLGNASSKEAA